MLKILSETEARLTYPPVVLLYGKMGIGKSTLAYTVGEAGWTPLIVNAERRTIKPGVIERLLSYGAVFAEADTTEDFEALFYDAKSISKFDAIVFDSLSALVFKTVSKRVADEKVDTRGRYGANLLTVLRGLFALQESGKLVILTALEKWDRGFGGVGVTSKQYSDERGNPKTKVEETDPAPEPYTYMPDFPGQLESKVGGIGCDIVTRMVIETRLDGGRYKPVRQLILEPGGREYVKTCYSSKNLIKPTMHTLLADYPNKPKERVSYEETLKLIEQDAMGN